MRSLLVLSFFALTACEGPEGPVGAQGDQGVAGQDGTDGTHGTDGTNGTDGGDSDCFGRAAVDITGLAGGDAIFYTNDPGVVTVEQAGTDALQYSVAGAGISYVWEGDSFTATATTTTPTSQVIIATDGCTMDTFVWEPEVEEGVFTLDLVHLVPGGGVVEVGVVGAEAATSLDFEERSRLVLPFGEYAFDVRSGGSVLLTVPSATYLPGSSHVVMVTTDTSALSAIPVDLGREPVADPATNFRLVGAHGAPGIGSVDVYDVYSSTLLMDDLAYGASDDLGDVVATEYGLAVDLDENGETDADLGRIKGADLVGHRVVATAYLSASSVPQAFAVDVDADTDFIVSTSKSFTASPEAAFSDTGPAWEGTFAVSGCTTVGGVNVTTDITHSYRGDVTIDLESPAGDTAALWENDGSYDDNIVGEFDATSGTDLSGNGDDALFTRAGLADFEGTNGDGDWTLIVADTDSYVDGIVESWTLSLDCPL